MKNTKKFPNGFKSWQETHFEIASFLSHPETHTGDEAAEVQEQQGHAGIYDLAEKWTDEFEKLHKGRAWDGEFFDEIEQFLNNKSK